MYVSFCRYDRAVRYNDQLVIRVTME